jgi:hypothetical protein
MESASNMYVRCCFRKWYMQLLCVHWCIVYAWASCLPDLVCVIALCSPCHSTSLVEQRSLASAPAFLMTTHADPSTMSPASGSSSPAAAGETQVCERRAKSGERKIYILLGNFRRSSVYFRGIRYIWNSIFVNAPHSRGHNNPKMFEKPTDPIGVEDCICYQTSYSICFKCIIFH